MNKIHLCSIVITISVTDSLCTSCPHIDDSIHPQRGTNIINIQSFSTPLILYNYVSFAHIPGFTILLSLTIPSPPPPPPAPPQWTEAGAGRGGQSLPPAVAAELLQPELLHPLLLALHLPAQPQAPVPRLPLQRLQSLPGPQQAGQSLALLRLPEEQVGWREEVEVIQSEVEGRLCSDLTVTLETWSLCLLLTTWTQNWIKSSAGWTI